LRWNDIPLLASLLTFGLLPLLYLPLRSASHPVFVYVGQYDDTGAFQPLDLTQPVNLLWYLSGGEFSWLIFPYSPAELAAQVGQFFHRLWASFLGVGLPLGLWGAWQLWRRERQYVIGLTMTALPHTIFFIGYGAPDKDMMFVPAFLIWAILLGVGLDTLERVIQPRVTLGWVLPLVLLLVNAPYTDVSQEWTPRDMAAARLIQVGPGAMYLAAWGEAAAMHYLQTVTGLRPDVTVINVFFTSKERLTAMVDRAFALGWPIYTTRRDSALEGRYGFAPIAHGYRLYRKGGQ